MNQYPPDPSQPSNPWDTGYTQYTQQQPTYPSQPTYPVPPYAPPPHSLHFQHSSPPMKPYSQRVLWLFTVLSALFWILCFSGQNNEVIYNLGIGLCIGIIVSVLILDARGLVSLQGAIKGKLWPFALIAFFTSPLWIVVYMVVSLIAYQRPPLVMAQVRRKSTVALSIGIAVTLVIYVMMATGAVAATQPATTTADATNVTSAATSHPLSHATVTFKEHTPVATQAAKPTALPTVTQAAKPTVPPTPTPIPVQPTQPPAPTPTPPPIHTGVNGNPWGYDFTPGSLIYSPDSGFCGYFTCVSTFWTATNGYVVECGDTHYSHSGGVKGACSRNGGVAQILYAH